MGQVERYHLLLRLIFNILKIEHPSPDDRHLLILALQGMNDTIESNGLVTTLFVFGGFQSCTSPNKHSLDRSERFEALEKERSEMETIIAEQRIRRALKSKLR